MKIKEISIENLFGLGKRKILLDPSTSVSILMGANGVGKSTLLEILHSCLTENWYRLERFRFDSLNLRFDDESVIEITRDSEGKLTTHFNKKDVNLSGIHGDIIATLVMDGDLIPLSCGHWCEKGKSKHLSEKQIIEKYSPSVDEFYPDELSNILRGEQSYLVRADRAFDVYEFEHEHRSGIHKILKVQITSQELIAKLKHAKEIYGAHAQRVQSEVVKDLISGDLSPDPDSKTTHEETISNFKTYKEYVSKLKDIGETEDTIGDLSLVTERVDAANVDWILNALLQRYNQLMEESVLDVSNKANRLFSFLEKALPYKEFKVESDSIQVISKINNESIPLDMLSSGEQQLFILGYEILFACPNNSIVMIDEPELSMDPKMQADFATFLDETFQEISCRYVLATHASLVVRGRIASIQTLEWDDVS